jgi:BMFP domain-containing protein YqiC
VPFTVAAVLAGVLLLSGPVETLAQAFSEGRPAPYVLITKDGHRIDTLEKPAVEGEQVRVRLSPGGQLALVPVASIDWEATEEYNAPPPTPVSKPQPAPPPKPEVPAVEQEASPGQVREIRIIGSKIAAALDSEAGGAAGTGGSDAQAADPNQAANTLASLTREMASLTRRHQAALQSRSRLEQEVASLEAKASKEPPASSVQSYESRTQKALARARSSLRSLLGEIGTLESRMNEIRFQALMLGGSVD